MVLACPPSSNTLIADSKRKRLRDMVQDVEQHVQVNGSWRYNLSQRDQAPEITAAVGLLAAEAQAKIAT